MLRITLLLVTCIAVNIYSAIDINAEDVNETQIEKLIEDLKNPEERVRVLAAARLNKSSTETVKAIPALTKALQDSSHQVRLRAATALGRFGSEAGAAIPELIRTLYNSEYWLSEAAAGALGQIGVGSISELKKVICDPNDQARKYAALALGIIGPDAASALPELTKALNDSSEKVRFSAAYAITEISYDVKGAVPELINGCRLENERAKALAALNRVGQRVLPELIQGLLNSDVNAQNCATEALITVGTKAVSVLAEKLSDSNVELRIAAAKVLGDIGHDAKSAAPELQKALIDPDTRVGICAAEAIGKIGPDAKNAISELLDAMNNSPDDLFSLTAAIALANLNAESENVIPKLLDAVSHGGELLTPALDALIKLGPVAIPQIANRIIYYGDVVDKDAATALNAIGSSAVPELIIKLNDSDAMMRAVAAKVLGSMSYKASSAIPELSRKLTDPSEEVREAAAEALENIRQSSPIIARVATRAASNNEALVVDGNPLDSYSGEIPCVIYLDHGEYAAGIIKRATEYEPACGLKIATSMIDISPGDQDKFKKENGEYFFARCPGTIPVKTNNPIGKRDIVMSATQKTDILKAINTYFNMHWPSRFVDFKEELSGQHNPGGAIDAEKYAVLRDRNKEMLTLPASQSKKHLKIDWIAQPVVVNTNNPNISFIVKITWEASGVCVSEASLLLDSLGANGYKVTEIMSHHSIHSTYSIVAGCSLDSTLSGKVVSIVDSDSDGYAELVVEFSGFDSYGVTFFQYSTSGLAEIKSYLEGC